MLAPFTDTELEELCAGNPSVYLQKPLAEFRTIGKSLNISFNQEEADEVFDRRLDQSNSSEWKVLR
jgi:hypothetical protein